MSWCALDIQSPPASRDAVAAWLVGRTGRAVEEREDGGLIGVTDREGAGALLDELCRRFGNSVAGSTRLLPEEDWTTRWRGSLGPRRIGRLIVTPSGWVPENAGTGLVIIDPETAFGTGEHGSTRTALTLLDRYIRPGDRVLDLGSGSGILAIAAVKLGAARAVGVDLDPDAESVARANAERNGVAAHAVFLTGQAETLTRLLGPVEIVVANILRSQNEQLLSVIRDALGAGGWAIFAGIEEAEAAGFRGALLARGFTVGDHALDGEWWGVAARAG